MVSTTRDTTLASSLAPGKVGRDTSVSVKTHIDDIFAQSKAVQKILIIDACWNLVEDDRTKGPPKALSPQSTSAFLRACSIRETSLVTPENDISYFTDELIQELRDAAESGRAFTDKDFGRISSTVKQKVLLNDNAKQTPSSTGRWSLKADGSQEVITFMVFAEGELPKERGYEKVWEIIEKETEGLGTCELSWESFWGKDSQVRFTGKRPAIGIVQKKGSKPYRFLSEPLPIDQYDADELIKKLLEQYKAYKRRAS